MRKFLSVLLISSVTVLFGQEKKAWDYAETINSEELKEHLNIIASDEYQGRETGKEGQKKAMKYLIKQFMSYGIQGYKGDKYTQSFPLIEQKNENISLTLDEKEFGLNKEFSVSPRIITKRNIKSDLIFVGYGIEEESYNSYKNLDIKGKAIFIMPGKPKKGKLEKEWTWKDKLDLAKEKGASAIFYYNENLERNLERFEHFYNRPSMKLRSDLKEEAIVVGTTTAITEYVLKKGKLNLKKIEQKGIKENARFNIPMNLSIDKPTENLSGENVLAFIPGTEKEEEVVVITAHYDHIGVDGEEVFNGADDDGTGTVSLLEIAQAFQTAVKDGLKPKRSILIMPVSGEEKGLLGSRYYTENPIFSLENTVANLNIDMIGRYDEHHEGNDNYVYLIGSDKLSDDLHELSEGVNNEYSKIELDYRFNDENDPNRFYYRSDHYNFAKNNIPVIFYFSGVHEDYHKSTDTVEKIDFDKTEKIARLVFMTAWEIANREKRIELNE